MTIPSLSNTYITQSKMEYDAQQGRVDGFQAALGNAMAKDDDKALRTACAEFESYFLYMMLKEMRKSVNVKNSMFYSHTEEIFQGLLDEEYGKMMAKAGGIGLADMMYRQMKQEASAEE